MLLPKEAGFFHIDRRSWPAMTSISMANANKMRRKWLLDICPTCLGKITASS